jgi:hypothetical protein
LAPIAIAIGLHLVAALEYPRSVASILHKTGHTCDCSAHSIGQAQKDSPHGGAPHERSASRWALLLPVLACAICPACLTMYAKLFSVLGISIGLSEFHHALLLTLAVTISVGVSAWRSWKSRRLWPLGVASLGSALVLFGHLSGDLHFLELAGVACLFVGGLAEQFRLKRLPARSDGEGDGIPGVLPSEVP